MDSLYHFGHPDFYVTKSEYFSPRGKIQLFLDITKKEEVLSVYFNSEGISEFNDLFSEFAQWMEGRELKDFPQFPKYNQEEFFPLLGLLFIDAVSQWKGKTTLSQVSDYDESSLICRCFGIYREQIVKEVFKDHEITTKGITQNIKAAGACTKCLEDVREIVSETKMKFGLIPEAYRLETTSAGKYKRVNDKTPAQVLLDIKDEVTTWKERHNLKGYAFKIVQFNGEQMTVKMAPREDYADLMRDLEEFIATNKGYQLRITSLV